MDLKVKRLTVRMDIPELAYATAGSSGLDLHAAIDAPRLLRGGESEKIPVGYAVEIPEGYEGQIRGRSGLAFSNKIGVTNGVGTIDSDYRGELCALLINHSKAGDEPLWIMPGMKIAQLVICPIAQVVPVEVDELAASERGEGGFGSTGTGLTDGVVAGTAGADAAKDAAAAAEALAAQDAAIAAAREADEKEAARIAREKEEQAALELDLKNPDSFVTLYDTVNKVLFTGHPSKVTDTVVVLTDEQAEAYIAGDNATDKRAPAKPAEEEAQDEATK